MRLSSFWIVVQTYILNKWKVQKTTISLVLFELKFHRVPQIEGHRQKNGGLILFDLYLIYLTLIRQKVVEDDALRAGYFCLRS